MRRLKTRRQDGFTFIEVAVTLILIGILAVIAGLGIASGVEGYLFARENAAIAQKAQLALTRMYREFSEITQVDAYDSTPGSSAISYENVAGARAIGLNGNTLRLDTGASPSAGDGDTLIDSVDDFSLNFFDAHGNDWNTGDSDSDLFYIEISLAINREGGGTDRFTTSVNPRNTGIRAGP